MYAYYINACNTYIHVPAHMSFIYMSFILSPPLSMSMHIYGMHVLPLYVNAYVYINGCLSCSHLYAYLYVYVNAYLSCSSLCVNAYLYINAYLCLNAYLCVYVNAYRSCSPLYVNAYLYISGAVHISISMV